MGELGAVGILFITTFEVANEVQPELFAILNV
jgi:hypothetical protein